MKTRILILTCLALLAVGSSAYAATTYATSASYYGDISGVAEARAYVENALGDPDADPFVTGSNIDFMSLGKNGSGVYSFGKDFDSSVTIYETTWGKRAGYNEYAQVLGSTDGEKWLSLGYVNNQSYDGYTLNFSGTFSYLMITDITSIATQGLLGDVWVGTAATGDGFDVNAVSISSTPIPGAVWLLGSGLLGLVGIRRRRSA